MVNSSHEIGRGIYGTVYSASYNSVEVAIKQIHSLYYSPNQQNTIFLEAEKMAQVRHPRITQFYGLFLQDNHSIGVVMERTPQTLKLILSSLRSPLPNEHIKKICMDICSALVYLHEVHHLVHGSISSANVLCGNLSVDNIYKLSDVYQAKFFQVCGQMVTTSSRAYAAPELLLQVTPVRTKQTDVYAFGVLCMEIAVNYHPEPNLHEINAKKMNWKNLQTIILECLSVSPHQRPSVSEILTQLSLI